MHRGSEQRRSIIQLKLTRLISLRQRCKAVYNNIYIELSKLRRNKTQALKSREEGRVKCAHVAESSDCERVCAPSEKSLQSPPPVSTPLLSKTIHGGIAVDFTFISRSVPQWSKRHLCPQNGSLCSGLCMDFISERHRVWECAAQPSFPRKPRSSFSKKNKKQKKRSVHF